MSRGRTRSGPGCLSRLFVLQCLDMGSAFRTRCMVFLAMAMGLCGAMGAHGAGMDLDLSFVPGWMKDEGRSTAEDSSSILQEPPDYRDLNGMLKALIDIRGSDELKELVYGEPDFHARDLSNYTFRVAEEGEELGFDLPLELAYLSLGFHDRYFAFLEAYGPGRLDPASVSRHLYTNMDDAALQRYLSAYAFNPGEAARIICNLAWYGNGELALALADRWKEVLVQDPALVAAVLDPAIERHDEALFDSLLAVLPLRDEGLSVALCTLHDFGYGFDRLFAGRGDTTKALELAVALSNAPLVEKLLPANPRFRLSKEKAAAVVESAMADGVPRNLYVYLLLLGAGFDEDRRYVNAALRSALSRDIGKPEMDLALRERLADAFIAAGASLNRVDPLYGPWLHWYASSGGLSLAYKKGMLRYLLSRGADPRARWQGLLYNEVPLSRRGLINETGVRLRKAPDLRSDVIMKLDKGTFVEILEMGDTEITIDYYTGIWYRVTLKGGLKGWVFGKYIDYVE